MLLFLLLQHIAESKPTLSVTQESGSNPYLAAFVGAICASFGTFFFTRLVIKPTDKVEQLEAAKNQAQYQALENSFNEFKTMYRATSTEWHQWRDGYTERTVRLELQTKNISEQVNEKINKLETDVTAIKANTQEISKQLTGLSVRIEQSIGVWNK